MENNELLSCLKVNNLTVGTYIVQFYFIDNMITKKIVIN